MNKRINYWILGVGLLLVAAIVAACGDAGNSNAPSQPTNPAVRRTAAPTRAAPPNVAPTQDPLDDSGNNGNNGPRPTQDPLDDSGGGNAAVGPETQNGQVVLPNTAWMELAGERMYRFCKNNAWEIVQADDTVTQKGTFKTDGAALALTDSANQQVTEYQMQWNAGARTLKLTQGNRTLVLEYDGKANCDQ
jgi:hypothetical protein